MNQVCASLLFCINALGTSACPNGQFHCTNAGHLPAFIPSSHVNDGVCDPLCCDGSDEYDGQITCPNKCKELGQAARKKAEEEAKVALKGWKVRNKYVENAKKKVLELEAEKERLNVQIVAAEQKEKDLKAALEKAEIRETKVSKFGEKIADRAREKVKEYQEAITSLRDEIGFLNERVNQLEDILEALKNDHNQNYHDMAVKTAVKGWEELRGQQFLEPKMTEEKLDILEKEEVDFGDDDVDFSNLTEFDETVSLRNLVYSQTNSVYRIQDYFPAPVKDFIHSKVASVRSVLVAQGFLADMKASTGPKVSRALQKARDAHAKAVTETQRLRTEVEGVSNQLSTDCGPDDVFRAIKDDCVSLDTGEYTYTVCIMKNVSQKSNKDSSTSNLGYLFFFPSF
jgi:hypothetical protein